MPTTQTTASAAEATLRAVEAAIHPGGWDQPHFLALLARPADIPEDLSQSLGQAALAIEVPGTDLMAYLLEMGWGDAYESLFGLSMPDWVTAIVLVTEAWAVEPATTDSWEWRLPASQHPRRREMRHAVWSGREGPLAALWRMRGEEPAMLVGNLGGRLADVTLRVMGREVEPTHPVEALLARGWVARVITQAEMADSGGGPTWQQVLAEAPTPQTWTALYLDSVGRVPDFDDTFAWGGVGLFANTVLRLTPTVADQLETLRVLAGGELAEHLRAELSARGLVDRSYLEFLADARRQPRNARCQCGSGQKAKHCCAAA